MLITLEHITKFHNEKCILNDVSFAMEDHDKIGIIGVNGTGKTTFLKIVSELEHYDEGKIIKKSGLKIHYLPQDPIFDQDEDVLGHILNQIRIDHKDVEEYEVKKILTKLGLSDFSKSISLLSGGQKKRLALACALVSKCDLLILDEPTNHLDNEMISWLEGFLRKMTSGLLMVTHDRYFLERITNRLLEIDQSKLYLYEGNYEFYLKAKDERMAQENAHMRKIDRLYKKELEWMRAGVLARGTKSQSRMDRFFDLRDRRHRDQEEKLKLSSLTTRLGKKTIELDGVSKAFGDHQLFKNFTYNFKQNDRIGILGENGCGKSTLLKCIMKEMPFDQGTLEVGETVNIAYFKQGEDDMDLNKRVIDYIRETSDLVSTKDGTFSAKTMLERFLFPSNLQNSLISRLSKGECRRLYLLKLLISSPNILLMDEPTNNLDIQTLSILEDYLDEFIGVVIVVSHDRYFLDRVCDHLFVFEEDHTIRKYPGGYSDYIARVKETTDIKSDNSNHNKSEKVNLLPRFTSAEKKEFESIDKNMEKLESQIYELDQEMNQCVDDFNKVNELSIKREELSEQLDLMMERWMYLNERNQEIQASKLK